MIARDVKAPRPTAAIPFIRFLRLFISIPIISHKTSRPPILSPHSKNCLPSHAGAPHNCQPPAPASARETAGRVLPPPRLGVCGGSRGAPTAAPGGMWWEPGCSHHRAGWYMVGAGVLPPPRRGGMWWAPGCSHHRAGGYVVRAGVLQPQLRGGDVVGTCHNKVSMTPHQGNPTEK